MSLLVVNIVLKGFCILLHVKTSGIGYDSSEIFVVSLVKGTGSVLGFDAVPSSEHVGFTLLTGKLLANDAGPGSKVVRATLLGCVPSQSLAS